MIIGPLYDRKSPDTAALVSSESPIELLDRLNLKPGELEMYVAYGGKDEFTSMARTGFDVHQWSRVEILVHTK